MNMVNLGPNMNPKYADSCAGAQRDALSLFDQQELGEPLAVTRARFYQINHLAAQAQELAKNIDQQFCESHCDPKHCIARTGETIIELNKRTLSGEGGIYKKRDLIDRLSYSDRVQTTSSEQDCPHLGGSLDLETILTELERGVSPGDLESIGYTDPHPHSPDQSIVAAIDPEETREAIKYKA